MYKTWACPGLMFYKLVDFLAEVRGRPWNSQNLEMDLEVWFLFDIAAYIMFAISSTSRGS